MDEFNVFYNDWMERATFDELCLMMDYLLGNSRHGRRHFKHNSAEKEAMAAFITRRMIPTYMKHMSGGSIAHMNNIDYLKNIITLNGHGSAGGAIDYNLPPNVWVLMPSADGLNTPYSLGAGSGRIETLIYKKEGFDFKSGWKLYTKKLPKNLILSSFGLGDEAGGGAMSCDAISSNAVIPVDIQNMMKECLKDKTNFCVLPAIDDHKNRIKYSGVDKYSVKVCGQTSLTNVIDSIKNNSKLATTSPIILVPFVCNAAAGCKPINRQSAQYNLDEIIKKCLSSPTSAIDANYNNVVDISSNAIVKNWQELSQVASSLLQKNFDTITHNGWTIARISSGIVVQKEYDYLNGSKTGLFIPASGKQEDFKWTNTTDPDALAIAKQVSQSYAIIKNWKELSQLANLLRSKNFNPITRNGWIIVRTASGVVVQKDDDYRNQRRNGLFIPASGKQEDFKWTDTTHPDALTIAKQALQSL